MGVMGWRAAVACAALGLAGGAGAQPKGGEPVVCPYTSDDIVAALGMGMKWQVPREEKVNALRVLSCTGIAQGANGYLSIIQTQGPKATAAKRFDAFVRTELKGAEPVPGDPDGAVWAAKPDIKSYSIAYLRGSVITRIIVSSPDKDFVPRLKDGLLKLRRLP